VNKLNEAVQFLRQSSIEPVLAHPDIPTDVKNKFEYVKVMLKRFRRIDDLIRYMDRSKSSMIQPASWFHRSTMLA
jgi:hypothetical protein